MSWLKSWGPDGQPNWADQNGHLVPIAKTTLSKLLELAWRGIEGCEQDSITYTEAHGVRE